MHTFSFCSSSSSHQSTVIVPPEVTVHSTCRPVFINKSQNKLLQVTFEVSEKNNTGALEKIEILFSRESKTKSLSELSVFAGINLTHEEPLPNDYLFGKENDPGQKVEIIGEFLPKDGLNSISFVLKAREDCDLEGTIKFERVKLVFGNTSIELPSSSLSRVYRFSKILREHGQDNCDTYRIPGLVTTNKGTLVAVFDNRYRNSGDLQGDIDIGMIRSTDKGQTWEKMKVILDMGSFGGLPEDQNGVGDPCILVDRKTNTIWVAALWYNGNPGKSVWNGSGQGLTTGVTGQILLVRSDDDGLTWSLPVNITSSVKLPEWYLFFQGPGRGITMKNGILVFPAQFRDENRIPHSTILWSDDHGSNWKTGTGAKPNTTESQVIELSNGTLMLNMRDDANRNNPGPSNGRAVATTSDLGLNWTIHPTSNSALPEPNCMASLINAELMIKGEKTNVLFFSNPSNRLKRSNMTIKASLDEGATWPAEFQLELNQDEGYGYSCLTMIDKNTIGILYEGIKDLYFQKIAVNDILENVTKSIREH